MTITATNYVFSATTLTATTTATSVGAYTVGASTRAQIIALTISNTATTNITNYFDCGIYNGSFATPIAGTKTPVYPGGSVRVMGAAKHVLPTSGAVQVTPYATSGLGVALTVIEVT